MNATKRRDLENRFALLEDRVFKIELRLGPETTTPPLEAAQPQVISPAASPVEAATPAPVEPAVEPELEPTIGLQRAGAIALVAGAAALFVAGYVGQAYYNLYSPSAALFLMAAAALVGALIAMRGNLVSIAVLSLLGANVAPLLVGSRNAPIESFLVYLLALQVVALSLASWGQGKKWWTLRALSLASTSLWVISIGLQPGHEALVSLFAVFYAILYHVELIISALRRRDDSRAESDKGDAFGPVAIIFALGVTTALALVILWATRLLEPQSRAGILLAIAAASALGGLILTRRTAAASRAIRGISFAHRIAATGILALAVPVAFSGLQTDVAWGLLALAFAVAGVAAGSKISRIAGIVVYLLSLLHLALSSQLPPELGGHPASVWFSLFGTSITREAGLAFALSAAGQMIAGLTARRESDADPSAISLSAVATAVWVIASVLTLPPLAATAWIVEYAWLLVAAEAIVPKLRFSLQAAALITLATIKWVVIDTLAEHLFPGWAANNYRPALNTLLGIGTLLCASILTLYSIRRNAIWRAIGKKGDLPIRSKTTEDHEEEPHVTIG